MTTNGMAHSATIINEDALILDRLRGIEARITQLEGDQWDDEDEWIQPRPLTAADFPYDPNSPGEVDLRAKAETGATAQGEVFTAVWRLLNGIPLQRGDMKLVRRAIRERPR